MVMVEEAEGGLAGIITDGDLRRFMEKEDSLTSATAAQIDVYKRQVYRRS